MNHTKASNALVATVDFYSSLVAELQAELHSKDKLIEQLGAQIKVLSMHEEIENHVLSAAVDWVRDNSIQNVNTLTDAVRKMIEANSDE